MLNRLAELGIRTPKRVLAIAGFLLLVVAAVYGSQAATHLASGGFYDQHAASWQAKNTLESVFKTGDRMTEPRKKEVKGGDHDQRLLLLSKRALRSHCHPIVREALKLVGIEDPHLEITSMADIPAGTGLGSSGSFTTALLKALHASKKNIIHPAELAEQACEIEIDRLGEPIGKQDQYIAAIGGITAFTFHPDGRVEYRPVRLSEETLFNLEDNLLLFFTGYSRSASAILKDQNDRSKQERPGHAGQPALHQGAGRPVAGRAGNRQPRGIRAPHGCALAAQESPLLRHEQPAHQRMVRPRASPTARSAAS